MGLLSRKLLKSQGNLEAWQDKSEGLDWKGLDSNRWALPNEMIESSALIF